MSAKNVLALFACLAALGLAAACGGGNGAERSPLSKAEYEQQVKVIGTRLKNTINRQFEASGRKGVAALMQRFGAAFDRAANDLSRLQPPPDIQAMHDSFVAATRGVAEEARAIAERIATASDAALLDPQFQKSLDILKSDAFERLSKAGTRIEAKGYFID